MRIIIILLFLTSCSSNVINNNNNNLNFNDELTFDQYKSLLEKYNKVSDNPDISK